MADRNIVLDFVRATEAAAVGSAKWLGKGNNNAADGAAVDAMRKRLNLMDFHGKVVIGEGERDEAPMLYIGEMLGIQRGGPKLDIAVDPLEGTNLVAQGKPNAISVLAVAPEGTFLHVPDTYMEKIAVGPAAKGQVDLEASVKDNLHAVADALGKPVNELNVIMLERERHNQLMEDVRKAGARITLIQDGDVAGAIYTGLADSGIDMLMGTGAAPEGVISAAALKCLGGEIQGKLKFTNAAQEERAKSMGFKKFDKVLKIDDLAKSDNNTFVASGVTDGAILKGVKFLPEGAYVHSLVLRSKTGSRRFIQTFYPKGHDAIV